MKRFITLAASLMVLITGYIVLGSDQEDNNKTANRIITICCPENLEPLSTLWADAYNKSHPGVSVVVSTEEPAAGSEAIKIKPAAKIQPGTATPQLITVCREVVVPVINGENPYMEELYQQGTKLEMLSSAYHGTSWLTWGELLGEDKEEPLHIYVSEDNTVKTCVTAYLGAEPPASSLLPPAELLNVIQQDKYAIGFCRLGSIIDPSTMAMMPGIRLLPIDRNGNGQLDYMESIYANLNELNRGVWIGKYPHSLVSNVYAVSGTHLGDESADFLEWVLTDGQVYLTSFGYSELAGSERLSQLEKLNPMPPAVPVNSQSNISPVAWYILGSLVVIAVLIFILRRRSSGETLSEPGLLTSSTKVFCEDCLTAPRGVLYDKTHTWAFREKDGAVKIGVDDFLGHVTGPVTAVVTRRPGQKISKGEELLSIIQKGKKIFLYSPISGRISELNPLLDGEPGLLRSSPYDKGWIYLVEPSNWTEEARLLQTVEKYTIWLKAEFKRLKDFLAATLPSRDVQLSGVVLQDGGLLKEGVLEGMDPEIWEEFQSAFIDMVR